MTTFAALVALTASTPAQLPSLSTEAIVRKLIAAVGDTDPDVRQNVAAALAKIGPASVPALTEALKDISPERRAGAAYALGQLGYMARPALPTLLDMLTDSDVGVRRQVSYAVSRIVPTGRPSTSTAVGPEVRP